MYICSFHWVNVYQLCDGDWMFESHTLGVKFLSVVICLLCVKISWILAAFEMCVWEVNCYKAETYVIFTFRYMYQLHGTSLTILLLNIASCLDTHRISQHTRINLEPSERVGRYCLSRQPAVYYNALCCFFSFFTASILKECCPWEIKMVVIVCKKLMGNIIAINNVLNQIYFIW
jgi:hypothetical protein